MTGLDEMACRCEIQRLTGEMLVQKKKFLAGNEDAGSRYQDLGISRYNYEARIRWLQEYKRFTTAPARR